MSSSAVPRETANDLPAPPDGSTETGLAAAEVFAGGGEMGALMRSIDWSKTDLGPVALWSQALRTMIGVLLRNRHPLLLWWGPRFVQLYNDAYRPITGTKHPKAMGQPASECWPEVWPTIEPMIQAPFSGRPATGADDLFLLLDRKGFIEESYFNLAYSPVPDDTVESTGIGGVLATVADSTKQVFGERQLKTLRELGARAAEAKTPEQACEAAAASLGENSSDVPFCLFYLLDPEGKRARLVARGGFGPGQDPASPAFIELDANGEDGKGWSLTRTVRDRTIEVTRDLRERFGALPQGRWSEPPRLAISLPLGSPDQPHPYGVLIAGVNPHRELNDSYQTFFELAAAQVVTAIHNARAHEEERLRTEKLAELDRAKTAFFSNVSHEFRTPLTLILGPLEDALSKPGTTLGPEGLDTVHRNALRLLKLVNTLLDFSRIEAGRTRAKHQPTDLSALTADLASAFRSLVEKAGLALTVDCPPLHEPVYVDREMYENIVFNLLSNAFKFTLEGGIRVSLDAKEGQARLVVADTGTGIPEAELPHLFERFHRVEGAKGRSYEGSGIGLALVQELARLHGGSISVESRVGAGSRFTVSFPLGKAHLSPEHLEVTATLAFTGLGATPFLEEASQWAQAADIGPAATRADAVALVPSVVKASGRILLADDNADMREYTQRLLTAEGWEVETVGNGEAALQRARARLPDLILTDVMMPGLDGFGLLKALKEDERTRAVPVILVSARAGKADAIEGMQKGADDYLVKPFSAKELVSRVAARLEIARARAEAVLARARLHALFMQAPVAVCVASGPDLVFELANPRYLEMVGREHIVGKTLRAAFPEVSGDSPVVQMLEKVVSSGDPFTAEEYCVALDRKGTGIPEDAYFKFTAQPVRDLADTTTGVMLVAVEVTVQIHARRRIESLVEELKLADRRKDEFLAMLAHELRNPMAAISMALSMLDRVQGDPARMARHRETARRQMGNLVRLVDDLLDVARITSGKVELRKEEVDLATIVQNALAAIRPTIEARGHELSVTVESGAFRIDADAARIEQVLANLLSNAAKYTEPGGTLSVRLARETAKGAAQAVLRVRDTGRGIPKDMLDKVFDLFVQVNPTIDHIAGGLGLGLTLARRLVEMHGGSIAASSEGLGKGSEFVVRLPLRTGTQLHADGRKQQAPNAPRKRSVLIVEDSEDLRDTLKEFLEDLGHEVAVAASGPEGVAKLLALRPDVALVDVGLPGIDGYEVARRVRAEPGGDKLYLVALTGYGGPEAKAKADGAGFDLHFTKPVDISELAEVVSRSKALDRS